MGESTGEVIRVQMAGSARARSARRVVIVSGAVVGLAALALAVTVVRPLPGVRGETSAGPSVGPGGVAMGEALERRESRLSAITAPGNVFATDRRAWPVDAPVGEAPDATAPEVAEQVETATEAPRARDAEIALTERPTSAATKSRDALELRGVFASGDRRFAMIQGGESDRRKDVELYREGDVFFAETWRVLRIDTDLDRVIIAHMNHGDVLALTMYDSIPTPVAVAEPAGAGVGVMAATESETRDRLLGAGIEAGEVDRLFAIMAELEAGGDAASLDAAFDEADARAAAEAGDGRVVAGSPEEPALESGSRGAGSAPAMPPGMAELLRSMVLDTHQRRRAAEQPEP